LRVDLSKPSAVRRALNLGSAGIKRASPAALRPVSFHVARSRARGSSGGRMVLPDARHQRSCP